MKQGTFSYFLKQAIKYKERYKNEEVSIIVFSANGFSSSITNLDLSSYKNNSKEYKSANQLISYSGNYSNPDIKILMVLWKKYFKNPNK